MSSQPQSPTIGFLRVASVFVLIMGALTLYRAVTTPSSAAPTHPAVGTRVPEVTLDLLKAAPNNPITTAAPMLIDFWSVDCVPCARARPGITDLGQRLSRSGVVSLSVNTDRPDYARERLDAYLEDTIFPGLVVRDSGGLMDALNIRVTPTLVLTSSDKRVLAVWMGRLDIAQIREESRALLAQASR